MSRGYLDASSWRSLLLGRSGKRFPWRVVVPGGAALLLGAGPLGALASVAAFSWALKLPALATAPRSPWLGQEAVWVAGLAGLPALALLGGSVWLLQGSQVALPPSWERLLVVPLPWAVGGALALFPLLLAVFVRARAPRRDAPQPAASPEPLVHTGASA